MDETPEAAPPPPASKPRRKSQPARRASAAPRPAKATSRKPEPASRAKAKPAASRKKARPTAGSLEKLLDGFFARASGTGARIASFSEDSFSGARRTLDRASTSTRKAAERLSREWKKMTPARRAQVATALLTALAAASASVVKSHGRKK